MLLTLQLRTFGRYKTGGRKRDWRNEEHFNECDRDFFEDYITEAGFKMPPARPYLPGWLAYVIAYITVWVCALLRPLIKLEPTVCPKLLP